MTHRLKRKSGRNKRAIVKHARRKRRPASKAIIKVPPAPERPWLINQEEAVLLTNAVCKGATPKELEYCLTVARRYRLDPFRKQIWFVPRWDSQATATDGKVGAKVWVPVVSIDGLLHLAARDHKDFGSYSEPEYGPLIERQWTYKGKSGRINAPEWARISTTKKGSLEPTWAKVWWEEIYPNIDDAPLVRRMPRLMLGKCAKAQVTRTAYPATGGLYIQEELHGREFSQFTPEGRIYSIEPRGSHEATREVAKRQLEEHLGEQFPTLEAAQQAYQKTKESSEGRQPVRSAGNAEAPRHASPTPPGDSGKRRGPGHDPRCTDSPESLPAKGKVSVKLKDDLTGTGLVTGDLEDICEELKKLLLVQWKDGAFYVFMKDVMELEKFCREKQYAFELRDERASSPTGSHGGPTPGEEGTRGKGRSRPPNEPAPAAVESVVKGVVQSVVEKTTKKNVYVNVLLKMEGRSQWFSCWHRSLFEALNKAKDKECEFFVEVVKDFYNIAGIKRIGTQEWDGKLPVVQIDREPGQKTLYP